MCCSVLQYMEKQKECSTPVGLRVEEQSTALQASVEKSFFLY